MLSDRILTRSVLIIAISQFVVGSLVGAGVHYTLQWYFLDSSSILQAGVIGVSLGATVAVVTVLMKATGKFDA